jgi:hypothetical protein
MNAGGATINPSKELAPVVRRLKHIGKINDQIRVGPKRDR